MLMKCHLLVLNCTSCVTEPAGYQLRGKVCVARAEPADGLCWSVIKSHGSSTHGGGDAAVCRYFLWMYDMSV